MPRFEIAPWLNHTCSGCGACCRRGFNIWCPPDNKEQYDKVEWPQVDSRLAGGRLFAPIPQGWRFTTREDGACRFLDDENLCIMHRQLGFDAKTLTCKMYPYNFVFSFGKIFVGLLFSCPSVVDDLGDPVRQQSDLLDSLLAEHRRLFPDPPYTDETALDFKRPLSLRNLAFLEQTLAEALEDDGQPLIRRVLHAGEILDRLETADDAAVTEKVFQETLTIVRDRGGEAARNRGLAHESLGRFERILLRQLQGMCSSLAVKGLTSEIFWNRQRARLKRLRLGLQYMTGRAVPECDSARSFPDVAAVDAYHLPPESEALLARYLRTRYASRVYYGSESWGLPVLQGARLTLMLPSLALWHAKIFAASDGRDAVNHADVREGVMLTDLTFGHTGILPLKASNMTMRVVNRPGWPQNALLHTMVPQI